MVKVMKVSYANGEEQNHPCFNILKNSNEDLDEEMSFLQMMLCQESKVL